MEYLEQEAVPLQRKTSLLSTLPPWGRQCGSATVVQCRFSMLWYRCVPALLPPLFTGLKSPVKIRVSMFFKGCMLLTENSLKPCCTYSWLFWQLKITRECSCLSSTLMYVIANRHGWLDGRMILEGRGQKDEWAVRPFSRCSEVLATDSRRLLSGRSH